MHYALMNRNPSEVAIIYLFILISSSPLLICNGIIHYCKWHGLYLSQWDEDNNSKCSPRRSTFATNSGLTHVFFQGVSFFFVFVFGSSGKALVLVVCSLWGPRFKSHWVQTSSRDHRITGFSPRITWDALAGKLLAKGMCTVGISQNTILEHPVPIKI